MVMKMIYEKTINKIRKAKKSKIATYYEIISNLFSAKTNQIFYYRTHLYRYFVRKKGGEISQKRL